MTSLNQVLYDINLKPRYKKQLSKNHCCFHNHCASWSAAQVTTTVLWLPQYRIIRDWHTWQVTPIWRVYHALMYMAGSGWLSIIFIKRSWTILNFIWFCKSYFLTVFYLLYISRKRLASIQESAHLDWNKWGHMWDSGNALDCWSTGRASDPTPVGMIHNKTSSHKPRLSPVQYRLTSADSWPKHHSFDWNKYEIAV